MLTINCRTRKPFLNIDHEEDNISSTIIMSECMKQNYCFWSTSSKLLHGVVSTLEPSSKLMLSKMRQVERLLWILSLTSTERVGTGEQLVPIEWSNDAYCTTHTARPTIEILSDASPNLNVLEYFLWDLMKSRVYLNKPSNLGVVKVGTSYGEAF